MFLRIVCLKNKKVSKVFEIVPSYPILLHITKAKFTCFAVRWGFYVSQSEYFSSLDSGNSNVRWPTKNLERISKPTVRACESGVNKFKLVERKCKYLKDI